MLAFFYFASDNGVVVDNDTMGDPALLLWKVCYSVDTVHYNIMVVPDEEKGGGPSKITFQSGMRWSE